MTDDADRLFEQLMAFGPIEEVANGAALNRIGMLIDLAGDLGRDDGTTHALEWANALAQRRLTDRQAALLEYFRANAWSNRQHASHRDTESAWRWEQPELQQQVYCLRRAAQLPGFEKLSRLRRCQILTNLGNQLSTLGRCVEAASTWSRALSANPHFGMALGNRGYGFIQYAQSLYDSEYRYIFLYFAHKDLSAALSSQSDFGGSGHQHAKAFFAAKKDEIESIIDIRKAKHAIKMDGHPTGTSKEEQHYRAWTLQKRLFLNPLNDLGPHTIAAHDMLSLPSFTTGIGEPPSLIGFFNQMKQEYVSGRWLLYDGLHPGRVHFSDRQVAIYNTLDYPTYSLAIEKTKAAYRIGYSLLDKIAFFLNDYARLGVDSRHVYFKTIWYENQDPRRGIRQELARSRNRPLRALYWLAKDLFDPKLQDVMEPDAQALYVIRNHLEHSYLKIHEMLSPRSERENAADMWTDRLAYSVSRSDFEAKTLQVFRLARAGLIYLSLGMHREEQIRAEAHPRGLKASMRLDLFKDAWKR